MVIVSVTDLTAVTAALPPMNSAPGQATLLHTNPHSSSFIQDSVHSEGPVGGEGGLGRVPSQGVPARGHPAQMSPLS